MSSEGEKGSVGTDADIDEAIAEALAAVERHASGASNPDADAADPTRIEELEAQLREEHDLRLRALADLDNHRKRAARERQELQRTGAEALMRDLLPVLDNLDRAVAALPEGPLALGVAMTRRHLEDTLGRHGLRPFSVEKGTVFDPRLHDAVSAVPAAEQPAGTVIAQESRGWFLHDRLLRPAAVSVAALPSVASDAE